MSTANTGWENKDETAPKNRRDFRWLPADESHLEQTDRSPQSVARAAMALTMRRCESADCHLLQSMTLEERTGSFLCDEACTGPQQAVRLFLDALVQRPKS